MTETTDKSVLTIGHSNHSLDDFFDLLRRYAATAVADVRSSPYSKLYPQFNREPLQNSLKTHGITYVFLGRELGGRPDDPSCYVEGRVQYRRLAQTQLFKQGLDRVQKGAQSYRTVLLCAEAEPLVCHRTLLVARELRALGIAVDHIRANGDLEPHEEAMHRLVEMLGMPERDLYRTNEEVIEDAIAAQEARVAYDGELTSEKASA